MTRTLQATLAEPDTAFHRRDHRAQAGRKLGQCRKYALALKIRVHCPDPPDPLAGPVERLVECHPQPD
jgi:hypothetical protein